MRAYVLTSGSIFGAIAVAHVLRMLFEDPHLALEPWYATLTLLAVGLFLWAVRVLWLSRRGRGRAGREHPHSR